MGYYYQGIIASNDINRTNGKDEFDTVGLGRYRKVADWIKEESNWIK